MTFSVRNNFLESDAMLFRIVQSSPAGDHVLGPIAIYSSLSEVSARFDSFVQERGSDLTISWAKQRLLAVVDGRSIGVQAEMVSVLADMMNVRDQVCAEGKDVNGLKPFECPMNWKQDLDRVLSYVVAQRVTPRNVTAPAAGQESRLNHSAPVLMA